MREKENKGCGVRRAVGRGKYASIGERNNQWRVENFLTWPCKTAVNINSMSDRIVSTNYKAKAWK